MNRKHKRLDELVRRMRRTDPSVMAALGDPVARQALFEEIVRMEPAESPAPSAPSAPPAPSVRRLRLAIVATSLVAVAAAVLALTGFFGSREAPPQAVPSPTTQSPAPQGDLFGANPAHSCLEMYSLGTIGGRAFAFDGTVTAIGKPSNADDPMGAYVPVTFHVNKWYRGGAATTVTVDMFPPEAGATIGNAPYQAGSRLLVAGESRFGSEPMDGPVAWACGFTRWYSEADAKLWQDAFS